MKLRLWHATPEDVRAPKEMEGLYVDTESNVFLAMHDAYQKAKEKGWEGRLCFQADAEARELIGRNVATFNGVPVIEG